MIGISWNFSGDKPIFQQLADLITLEIISGNYSPGSKLEGVRELALNAGVNPNTMQRALSEIEATGAVYTKRGDGRYVTEDARKIAELKEKYLKKNAEIFASSVKKLNLGRDEILGAVALAIEKEENNRG